ncbi:MAG: hypothetical protein A3H97_16510 [Acidobacteria bacterium RIFCSPLOWO2_02_FULL_65_29]|nr:MAG: hypothetical protein A3H97_16510 [Acidobacteria bacterium RIFCSPLOWO2_02_FULL_65_29]
MRALVADDDRLNATLVARSLEKFGLDVVVTSDGAQAWKRLEADPAVSLAILDWMMPGIDGPELCRRIRSDEARASMYVLLLTARDSRTDLVAGLDAGANDYLTKPFDPDELRARVDVGLRVLALQQRLAERVAELQDALAKVKRLSGLLPICSYCKSVRKDHDYWEQVEQYVSEHSDVQFSHGICPACFDKVSAQFEDPDGVAAAGPARRHSDG